MEVKQKAVPDPKLNKEELVALYLPLVKKIAQGLARRSTDPLEDLIQVGAIGLLEAIERFEESRNVGFKTYASHLITGQIRHYLRDRQNLLRGPRVLQELSYRLKQVAGQFSQDHGREPSYFELSELLSITPDQVEEVRMYDRRISVVWLDQEINDGTDEEYCLLESISGGEDMLDERFFLAEAIEQLPDPLRSVLRLRFFEDLTQVEIAARLGLSQMVVCRRLKQAEDLLRVMGEE